MAGGYVGRFAPSPTGPLHAGSLVAALASALDARAHRGRWLVRVEDLDPPREVAGASAAILAQLRALGFRPGGPVMHQSTRGARYREAFETLRTRGLGYPCACTRTRDRRRAEPRRRRRERDREVVYPGTCRDGTCRPGAREGVARDGSTGRSRAGSDRMRRGGTRRHLAREMGDFVVRRADGYWAYQLAVVVDDEDAGRHRCRA